jgi:hypothetical protein
VETQVYFIRAGVDGPVKIGIAREPLKRLRDLQVANPVELRLLAVTDGGRAAEVMLHRTFRESRVRGEWFEMSSRLEAVIEEAAGKTPVPGSFAELVALEPRLEGLCQDARDARRRRDRGAPACSSQVMRRQIEPRLRVLCGWGRRLPGDPRSRVSYEVAHAGLMEILGGCEDGCLGCALVVHG